MRSTNGLGLLLFITSAIVVMAASASSPTSSSPFRRYLRRNQDRRSTTSSSSSSSKRFKYHHSSHDAVEPTHGILISSSSVDFKSNEWRQCVSVFEDDSDDISCEVEFINEYGQIITLCWVSDTGELHHFYSINDDSIKDGSVSNSHVEYTRRGHSFVGFLSPELSKRPLNIADIPSSRFVFLYQPNLTKNRHLVCIKQVSGSGKDVDVTVRCKAVENRGELLDTTDKVYVMENIAGFTVHCESGVFESVETLQSCLVMDLEAVCALLPCHILRAIQRDISIWLNKSISYGFKSNPIIGKSCNYHSVNGHEWLWRHGLSELKAGCIEVFCAKDYVDSRNYWGIGGLLLHELCHCVHDRYAIGGYDCASISEAYENAIVAKLYDSVCVRGPQGSDGRKAKAYACANRMEFFAELSVAYLWNMDSETEFNKWFPHNRSQLAEHDPATFVAFDEFWTELEDRLAIESLDIIEPISESIKKSAATETRSSQSPSEENPSN